MILSWDHGVLRLEGQGPLPGAGKLTVRLTREDRKTDPYHDGNDPDVAEIKCYPTELSAQAQLLYAYAIENVVNPRSGLVRTPK
jgi:hypothetical protein